MDRTLAEHFAAFAGTTRRRAPLYSRLGSGIAGSPLLAELYADVPGPARTPVTLFAAVQYLLLAEPDAPLARFYPNLATAGVVDVAADPVPAFLDFCVAHAADVRALVATRLPQTNEVGRSALLVAGLGQLEPGPIALLDVGASAGLNLLLDRFGYADGAGNVLGDSPVLLECAVRGERPRARTLHGLAESLPTVTARLGLDARPIDLADPDAARWLEACVWADQADRFERLRQAIALFADSPVEVREGDAVRDLAGCLDAMPGPALPVVITSWVLCYLEEERQREFVAELERLGTGRDLSWVWAEAPDRVPALPVTPELAGGHETILGLSTWRDGVRADRVLARCHPHGYWLNWY